MSERELTISDERESL